MAATVCGSEPGERRIVGYGDSLSRFLRSATIAPRGGGASAGEHCKTRAERGRQLADLRQQGYDYRPRQQVCINKQLTRQKMQKFRL